jgi:hypothetical protein
LKRDSLYFKYDDGLQKDSILIPMSVLSTWTINYEISDSRARPSTPSRSSEFIDTIFISNNKENRTRITSIKMKVNFNPRNVMIKDFKLNSKIFPEGWSWEIDTVRNTEKYGYISFNAQADTNLKIQDINNNPEDLSYFISGTNQKNILGYLKVIQLLGTSDTTEFTIDTVYSQHNYDTRYVSQKDFDNVLYKLPYIKTLLGKNYSDSLIFQNKLLLNSKDPSVKIQNVYPNPILPNNNDLNVVIDVLKDTAKVKLKIIEIVSGNIVIDEKENIYYNKGQNTFPIGIKDLYNGSYLLIMTTETNIDVWIVKINK